MAQKDRPDIETLLPHRLPMRLIDAVLEIDDDHIETLAIVKETWPLCTGGGTDMILSVEMIAQSVAALYHERKKRQGEPQIDFLVGIKEARFHGDILPLNSELRVNVTINSVIGNYGTFQGKVTLGGDILCEALVQVLEPGEELLDAIISGRKREVKTDG